MNRATLDHAGGSKSACVYKSVAFVQPTVCKRLLALRASKARRLLVLSFAEQEAEHSRFGRTTQSEGRGAVGALVQPSVEQEAPKALAVGEVL